MRTSGVLLPVFSLPGRYGIGCFSNEAYKFVDFLRKAGQTYWQILPLGPTSYGDSPYQSFSTFAGNPYFIDLEELVKEGLLTESECDGAGLDGEPSDIDYPLQYQKRYELLRIAYKRSDLANDTEYKAFYSSNRYWLDDYSVFMAVKKSYNDQGLETWDDTVRMRRKEAVESRVADLSDEIGFQRFLQFEFDSQWKRLKSYANRNGIRIIGDMPIYVSADSSDVWANPELFQLDESMRPIRVAGCPPDAFSDKGQLWGNPLYAWDYHKKTGYDWWKKRIEKASEWYDIVRIDHFRGFDQYYSIPAGAEDAVNGEWMDGPGYDLFKELIPVLKENNAGVIAEDLGFITDSVRKLVKDTGFPNMKVLEFAFGGRDDDNPSEYLPFNYDHNCIAYTGTHDNETLVGWLKGQPKKVIKYVAVFTGVRKRKIKKMARALIKEVIASPADFAVIPLQDWLGLDNRARINTPSTLGGNWRWRFTDGALTDRLASEMKEMTLLYGRKNPSFREKRDGDD